jgi:hypothetical protein
MVGLTSVLGLCRASCSTQQLRRHGTSAGELRACSIVTPIHVSDTIAVVQKASPVRILVGQDPFIDFLRDTTIRNVTRDL